jgi:multimeric flavodoxin WrbA
LTRFDGLTALFVNTTLKRDAASSHTQRLLNVSAALMRKQGVATSHLHFASHEVAPGVRPDMREEGYPDDAWPDLWPRIIDADILVVGTPIWLGEESSLCRRLVERLYAMSGQLNDKGQSVYYGRVAGCVITGNEDGLKHISMSLLYALNHLGYTIPPQADCGWIGEAGPGPSYGDEQEGQDPTGFDNEFTQRNTTIMSYNCMHLARMLVTQGGIDTLGNDREAWENGERFGFENPGPV